MKKIVTLLAVLTLGISVSQAQVVDTNEQKQYQESLQQQQQQLLLQQQEQEKALKANQKEQAKVEKEMIKAEKEAEKEAIKAEKEAARAEKEAKAEAKRQRREEIGRGSRIGIDPYAYLASTTRATQYSDPYNSASIVGLGANLTYHYPLNKKIDFVIGLGYKLNLTEYTNFLKPNDDHTDILFNDITSHFDYKSMLSTSSIMVPIHLNFVRKEGRKMKEIYLGVNAGYTFKSTFAGAQLNADNQYEEKYSVTDMKNYKKMRLDFVFGFNTDKFLFFSPGVEVFFNILPTYIDGTNNNNPIHEFGVKIQL